MNNKSLFIPKHSTVSLTGKIGILYNDNNTNNCPVLINKDGLLPLEFSPEILETENLLFKKITITGYYKKLGTKKKFFVKHYSLGSNSFIPTSEEKKII